jgi:hypothetical protein
VPAVKPPTTPVAEPIVAMPVLLLLQVPPVVALVSVIDEPAQTALPPDIADGAWFTITKAV